MYFAIIGNHYEITLKELQSLHPKNFQKLWDHLIIFDTNEPQRLPHIASLIKWGEVLPFSEIEKILKEEKTGDKEDSNNRKRILGIADKVMGINFKKKYSMKRFKQVDILHTDMEVKNKGIELIKIKGEFWIVQGYQNIKLYEVIDFEKPGRSMQVGMMPAKLTHTLLNIALWKINSWNNTPLIFDPFCWTGTTGFLANALGYHFIGSDIKLNLALQNQQRRNLKHNNNKNLTFDFFEQDISKPLNTNFSELSHQNTLIVTEGWLGPVIKQTTTAEEITEYQRRVKNLYLQFIQTITDFFPKKIPMVFTIPIYIDQENTIEQYITDLTQKLWRKMESIDEIYKREKQKVGRQIIILQWN